MTPQTPMLKQYFQHKAEHPDVLMAMRVGDFYEFYGEDAETAAKALEITLTGREDGSNGRISMAGVPYHSVEKYLSRLVQAGYKVALCDQVEDPKTAKGLVRRAVTRVLTAGTLLEDSMLESKQNNYLTSIYVQNGKAGVATLDPSTGEFLVTEIDSADLMAQTLQELLRIRPSELLVSPGEEEIGLKAEQALNLNCSEIEPERLERASKNLLKQLGATHLAGFGCEDKPNAVIAASMILNYAAKVRLPLNHVDSIAAYSVREFVSIDPSTRRALELTANLSDGSRRFTLLATLDHSVTSMGARLMRKWVEQPMLNIDTILHRQRAVGHFNEQPLVRGDLREALGTLGDIERLTSRCSAGLASPRDLALLGSSLAMLSKIEIILESIGFGRIAQLIDSLGDHRALATQLAQALVTDPPLTMREGGVIRDDYDLELDQLRSLSREGKSYISKLEQQEKSVTGISSLKVGFNNVFGYYLEISKRDMDKVPEHYIRKQTTANAERYITAELKEQEFAVLGAKEKSVEREQEIFARLIAKVNAEVSLLLQTARSIAEIDVLSTFSEVATRKGYICPKVIEENLLKIEGGRHPVVETNQPGFVPNDLTIATEGEEGMRLMVLTGPNMSGKSTYLRQNALLVIMAQMGSYIPATNAEIGICDAIFSRIGAKDELALGQSTFMVEMLESAYILNHATAHSLVVLDEVGRGTSTYDGLAIAWAMIEELARLGAKTLFATHYHQLNVLAETIPSIENYRVAVQEIGDQVVWSHRVLKGGTDRSYGIHVAKSAGMPSRVIARSEEILNELESDPQRPTTIAPPSQRIQLSLFEAEEPEIVKELRKLDVYALTPMQAMQLLDYWKTKL